MPHGLVDRPRGQVTYITRNGRPRVAFVPADAAVENEKQQLA